MSKKAQVDKERCDRSPLCPAARTCQVQAIQPAFDYKPEPGLFSPYQVIESKCTGCGQCVLACPRRAIFLRENSLKSS